MVLETSMDSKDAAETHIPPLALLLVGSSEWVTLGMVSSSTDSVWVCFWPSA